MKLKGLLVIGISAFLVFLIYLSNIDSKIYYLTLGDYSVTTKQNGYTNIIRQNLADKGKLETYVTEFNTDKARITDLINDINQNKKVVINHEEKTLKNALIKADFVIVSVGSNDLFYELETKPTLTEALYDKVDQILADGMTLYQLLRKYCKEDIFVTGFYNPYEKEYDELIEYANTKLKKQLADEDITYINVQGCVADDSPRIQFQLTEENNQCVANKIKNQMRTKLFEEVVASQ